jgi:GT2 family glycosyltransferase
MIASLIYNTPELIPILRAQVPEIFLIDVSDEPLEGCDVRYETNLLWAQNWHRFLMETDALYVWMLNSDVKGFSLKMYAEIINSMGDNVLMSTPSFNSPHAVFHQKPNTSIQLVNWIDMTCPVIDVELYRKLGGFDPVFKGYFADIDLSYRARQAGYLMYVDHAFKLKHEGGYTVKKTGKWEQAAIDDNEFLVKKYGKSWHELI